MENKPFTPQPETSAGSSRPSMNQRLAYASQRAEVLFGCYRRGDANDPERYVAAIAAVLSDYDFDLMKEVTDPRTGICSTEKFMTFMPNAGELKVYCETLAACKDRLKRLGERRAPVAADMRLEAPEQPPGYLANVHIPASHPRYAALVEWSKTAEPRMWKLGRSSDGMDGIWIPLNVWQDGQASVRKAAEDQRARSLVLSQAAQKLMKDIDEARSWGERSAAE
jgi:hypothetical protein